MLGTQCKTEVYKAEFPSTLIVYIVSSNYMNAINQNCQISMFYSLKELTFIHMQ